MNAPPSGKTDLRISVVMCTYNGGRYLAEQLESILSQTLLPDELIVCDDHSTDETAAILRSMEARAPFRVRRVENSLRLGSTANFDQAIGMAEGDFIALSDQDDRWLPAKLEVLARELRENPFLGGVFSDAELIDADGHRLGMRLFERHKFTRRKQRQFLSSPTATLLKYDVVTGATLMFRSAIRPYCSPIPRSWVHDGWLAWMLALHARLALIPEPLVEYRIHQGQQLGVGSHPGKGSLETRRQFYARVALQFEDLLDRVIAGGWSERDGLVERIREKIGFLKRQSALSPSLGVRSLQMLGLLPDYLHYARGLGALRTDLLLGRETL